MRAKTVNEAIKHLTGRPEEELYKAFSIKQIEMYKQIKEYLVSKKIIPRIDPGMLEFYYGDLLFEIIYYEDKNEFTYTIFQNIHDYKTGDEGTYIHKYATTFTTFEEFKELLDKWVFNTNESIKHLTPHSKEHLKSAGYDEKYANWKPGGSMTLNNWGGIEIKIIDNGDAVEYRFNYGDDDFKPVIEADIEWGIDEDNPEMEDGEPISEPYFTVGEDKYFLKDFMRTDR